MKFKTLMVLIVFGFMLDGAITLWMWSFDPSSLPSFVLGLSGFPSLLALILCAWFVIKLAILLDKLNKIGG